MLNLDRRRALDPQYQRARLALVAVGRANPLDLDRLAARGNVGADDLGPARHQFGRSEALLAKRLAHGLADEVAQRLGEGAGGLVHDAVLCHPSAGPFGQILGDDLSSNRSSQARGATARQAPDARFMPATHRLAGLVRPPSPQAAVARAAGPKTRRSVPGLALRDHAAADHGQ